MAPPDWANRSARLDKILWHGCSPAIKEKIALFCRTPQIAERFRKHADIHAKVLPFALPAEALARQPSSARPLDAPMVVSFVGGARPERGYALVADIVERCSASGVRFFIQVKNETAADTEAEALAGLARWPHVQIQDGVLERDDYYRAIADSVVLLAYDPAFYHWRDSGVYREALMLGAPVLVSAGTSMAEEVNRRGNGLIIENLSAAAIADCIGRAQRKLPALRTAAKRVAQDIGRTEGVANYISTVLGAFDDLREAHRH
jgi:glycosyltransferase involved in cell wall biosynthesis